MMSTPRMALGALAEDIAARSLESRGYTILDRNFRRPWGELDIVAKKGDTVMFVEVKANRQYLSGFEPELRANRAKMEKVIRTARTWLSYRKYPAEQPWQIDILSVTFNENKETAQIKHFKNI